jgi:hypothetical protein
MKTAKQKKYRHDVHVEELVIWTYQRQKADLIVERGVGLYPQEKDADGIFHKRISGDGVYQIHRNQELGVRVDCIGFPTADIHPDAETVHELIKTKAFTHLERGLLIDFGKTGLMPDWMPGAKPEVRPALKKNGKLKMIHSDRNKTKPIACEIEIVMTQDHIDFKRSIYTSWLGSLEKLCGEIWKNDLLMTSFNVLPPAAEKEPWKKS